MHRTILACGREVIAEAPPVAEGASLTATPAILVNGFMLPREYELEDLAMIAYVKISVSGIIQDIHN